MGSGWLDILEPPRGGRFQYDRFTVADPAAGAPLIFKLDSAFDWWVVGASVRLVTDATVATRLVTIDLTDPDGTVWVRSPWGSGQAASLTADYSASPARTQGQNVATAAATNMMGDPGYWFPGGMHLRINVMAIQAGDQLSGAKFYVAKYATGPRE